MCVMSDDLVERLRELRSNQYADSNTAPEFVFLDPDLPPSEWEKQYGMDVVYVRGDVMWLNLKDLADRIDQLAAINEELEKERDDYAFKLNEANNTYTEMHIALEAMSDHPNLCPSCREPLDYPSGDGCAAMTKHKPVKGLANDRLQTDP